MEILFAYSFVTTQSSFGFCNAVFGKGTPILAAFIKVVVPRFTRKIFVGPPSVLLVTRLGSPCYCFSFFELVAVWPEQFFRKNRFCKYGLVLLLIYLRHQGLEWWLRK